jgi:hypothetical protein
VLLGAIKYILGSEMSQKSLDEIGSSGTVFLTGVVKIRRRNEDTHMSGHS